MLPQNYKRPENKKTAILDGIADPKLHESWDEEWQSKAMEKALALAKKSFPGLRGRKEGGLGFSGFPDCEDSGSVSKVVCAGPIHRLHRPTRPPGSVESVQAVDEAAGC